MCYCVRVFTCSCVHVSLMNTWTYFYFLSFSSFSTSFIRIASVASWIVGKILSTESSWDIFISSIGWSCTLANAKIPSAFLHTLLPIRIALNPDESKYFVLATSMMMFFSPPAPILMNSVFNSGAIVASNLSSSSVTMVYLSYLSVE